MFSKTCEYGIRAVIYIATQSLEGKRVKINEISQNSNTPTAYTTKILGFLTKDKLVFSQTGPTGGFYVDVEKIHKVRLADIIKSIDGDEIFHGCALGLEKCGDAKPCPLHHHFVKVREDLKNVLNNTSLYDLAMGIKSGKSVLNK